MTAAGAKKSTKRVSHNPKSVAGLDKREKIVELRKEGYSYADIGRMVGVSRDHAHATVKDYMADFRQRMSESLEQTVLLEVERLNECIRVMYQKVIEKADCDAAKTMTTLMHRKASYLGLDKASKLELQVEDKKVYVSVSPDDWKKMSDVSSNEQTNIPKI